MSDVPTASLHQGSAPAETRGEPIIAVRNLSKTFAPSRGLLGKLIAPVKALEDVSLSVRAGKTLAIVGESGSGKTTLGRCIAGLYEATAGSIAYRGRALSKQAFRRDITLRKSIQMIFQDPAASLNPRQRVRMILAEPLIVHGLVRNNEIDERVATLLRAVGLAPDAAGKLPHQFSGGQKQRIAIARALTLEPDVLICDEAVSALDVSVQAQIVNLLKDLQRGRTLTYLFISHDMAVVRHIADDVAVMKEGHLIETGPTEQIFSEPKTPYTRALLDAVPRGIALRRGTA
jgi:ABC-type glutathione transport system ATPase component